MRLVLLFLILFFVDIEANGYPSNTRYGYTSCRTCHVSPTGGGVLTSYGKSTGDETATWSYEGESEFLHGAVVPPKWLSIGGDSRTAYIDYTSKDYKFKRTFPMQTDGEIALLLSDQIAAVGSAGVYGEERKFASRRHYLLLTPKPSFTLRFGKFFPAFGIMVPDHTAITRKTLGFEQGFESYNLEASITGKGGEFFITAVLGKDGELQSQSEKGLTLRGAIYAGKSSQVGMSFLYLTGKDQARFAFGPYALIGWDEKLYSLTEFDLQYILTEDYVETYRKSQVGLNQVGYELFKGFHLLANLEYYSDVTTSNGVGIGAQWFPRPHFEFLWTYTRRTVNFQSSDTTLAMFHYHF